MNKNRLFSEFQKLGKVLMAPVLILPIAGILVGIGSGFTNPKILLMDEPFGALDALTRDSLNIELLKIWEQTKKTILFVTHSIDEAVFLSSKVIVMSPRPGRIKEILDIDLGYPRTVEIRNNPEFIEYSKYLREVLE